MHGSEWGHYSLVNNVGMSEGGGGGGGDSVHCDDNYHSICGIMVLIIVLCKPLIHLPDSLRPPTNSKRK